MTTNETLTLLISCSTLALSLVVFVTSKQTSERILEIENNNLKQNMAQTELYIQELLVNARTLFLNINLEKLKLAIDPTNVSLNAVADQLTLHSLQEILNAYEVACMKYLDAKIDKERFKKTYHQEIRQLFETEGYKSLLDKANSFHAIKKVNTEWHNLEGS
jgi:hypothetical protein